MHAGCGLEAGEVDRVEVDEVAIRSAAGPKIAPFATEIKTFVDPHVEAAEHMCGGRPARGAERVSEDRRVRAVHVDEIAELHELVLHEAATRAHVGGDRSGNE